MSCRKLVPVLALLAATLVAPARAAAQGAGDDRVYPS